MRSTSDSVPVACWIAGGVACFVAGCGFFRTEPPPAAIDLRDDSVNELVSQLAGAVGEPVIVDPSAATLARCARVTLVVPGSTPRQDIFTVVDRMLRASALSVRDEGDHLLVTRLPDVEPPARCAQEIQAELAAQAARPQEPVEPSEPPPIEGIRMLEEHLYEFDRSSPTFAIDEQTMMGLARVIPHEENGVVVGMRIYGIRRRSVLGALGLRNGDLVRSVNGRSVATAESMDAVVEDLGRASRIVVELERAGEPLTLTYVASAAQGSPTPE